MPNPKYPRPRNPDHIGVDEVLKVLEFSRTSFYRYREEPDFPQPIGNDGRAVLYSKAAVQAWKRSRQPKE